MTTQDSKPKRNTADSNAINWRYGNLSKSDIKMVKKWLGAQRNKNESITQVILHIIQRYGYKDVLNFDMQRQLFADTLLQDGSGAYVPPVDESPQAGTNNPAGDSSNPEEPDNNPQQNSSNPPKKDITTGDGDGSKGAGGEQRQKPATGDSKGDDPVVSNPDDDDDLTPDNVPNGGTKEVTEGGLNPIPESPKAPQPAITFGNSGMNTLPNANEIDDLLNQVNLTGTPINFTNK